MTMSDPLGDMLTRIRNGLHAGKTKIRVPASKHKASVLDVLVSGGYIRGYNIIDLGNNKTEIEIEAKYDTGEPVIREIKRISKPGRRVYYAANDVPRFYNGLGVTIVSTSRGVMADHEAREQNVGGEILCQVF
ncbi:MAG: 30S ribosomal protein S8 [Alphaproteobacteria bacterium CG_4_9_14_3_um_filter_47_13]|nr:MAG: 30S ribosomal protein S8 [Alphaproteobacteria bacterium CG_4_9_14_3_um_filter_47_13]